MSHPPSTSPLTGGDRQDSLGGHSAKAAAQTVPRERPILFQGEMVRAILAGTKTQTRRVMRDQPPSTPGVGRLFKDRACTQPVIAATWADAAPGDATCCLCPYGVPRDRLWVRETWQAVDGNERARRIRTRVTPDRGWIEYAATPRPDEPAYKWRPSIHMPRWACRLVLEVTAVRVERLQDISEADARAEGSACVDEATGREVLFPDASRAGSWRLGYRVLWERINGAGSWDANPWVWAVSFRRIARNGLDSTSAPNDPYPSAPLPPASAQEGKEMM